MDFSRYLYTTNACVACCVRSTSIDFTLQRRNNYLCYYILVTLIFITRNINISKDTSFFAFVSFLLHRYRPVYKAFRSDSSFNFMIFFVIFFFQFLMLIYQAIGVHGSGYCGYITALQQFNGTLVGVLTGIMALSVAAAFTVGAAGSFLLLTKV